MIKRTIEISHPAYLKRQLEQLVIEQQGEVAAKVPFEDLGVLILAHPQITVTQAVLSACTENNIALIHCDQSHLPAGLTLPLSNHSLHSKVIKMQAGLGKVRRKQLWQQIVREKIFQQAETLRRLNKNHKPLYALIDKVKSADSGNMEAQAAQRYWKLLVDKDFRRNPQAEGVNTQLNYGYAIVRAMVARALVGTGLHPGLGVNHTNQYNSYCLADDLMEPFRAWVDEITMKQTEGGLNQATKSEYLTVLAQTVLYQKRKMPLMVAVGEMTALFKQAYLDKKLVLRFPQRT